MSLPIILKDRVVFMMMNELVLLFAHFFFEDMPQLMLAGVIICDVHSF